MIKKIPEVRQPSDHAVSLDQAILSVGPKGAALLASLMQSYIPSTLEKRRSAFINELAEDLERLKMKIKENKIRSEDFHITLIKTMREAILEKHTSKLAAFRAIVLNEFISETENPETEFFLKIT